MVVFKQDTPSTLWTIAHKEGANPIVSVVVDHNGKQEMILPLMVEVVDATTVKVSFTKPYSGVALVRAGGV